MRGETVVKDVIIHPAYTLQMSVQVYPCYSLIFCMTNVVILHYKYIPINYQSMQLMSVDIVRTITWVEGFGCKKVENNF